MSQLNCDVRFQNVFFRRRLRGRKRVCSVIFSKPLRSKGVWFGSCLLWQICGSTQASHACLVSHVMILQRSCLGWLRQHFLPSNFCQPPEPALSTLPCFMLLKFLDRAPVSHDWDNANSSYPPHALSDRREVLLVAIRCGCRM